MQHLHRKGFNLKRLLIHGTYQRYGKTLHRKREVCGLEPSRVKTDASRPSDVALVNYHSIHLPESEQRTFIKQVQDRQDSKIQTGNEYPAYNFKFGINPFSKWRQSLPLGKSRLIIISQSSGEKHLRCPKNVKIEFVLSFSISAAAGDAVLEAKLRSQCFSQELFRIHKRTID